MLSCIVPLDSTAPLVDLRPSSNFFIHSPSTRRSVQETTPESVLSLWNSLPQKAYGMVRVSRNEWPVPQLTGLHGMMRVPRNLDPALYHCLVLGEFLSACDPTMILVVELLESFISAYYYSVQCPSLCFGKKPSVLLSENIHFGMQLKAGSYSEAYLLLPFEQSTCIYCINSAPNSLIIEIESPRCFGNMVEVSS